MLTRLIVYFAYFLKTSSYYRRWKGFFYDLLENPQSRLKFWFDIFMITVVMTSVILLIYEESEDLGVFGELFERFLVIFFIAEYLTRAWLYSDCHKVVVEHYERSQYLDIPFRLTKVISKIIKDKWEYIWTPTAIIDLLAILPSYRPLRLLRIFLIFRLLKLFRYSRSIKAFVEVLYSKRFELYTLAIFFGFLIFIASTAIYHFENAHRGGQIKNLYDAAYWAIVTMSTVGYGDITPQTNEGRFVALALIMSGLGVLSFFTSIFVVAFNEKMHVLRENRVYAEIEKLQDFIIICGYGQVGQEVAELLYKDKQKFVIIDKDDENIQHAKSKGFIAIHNDATRDGVLKNAGIKRCNRAVLCTTGNDVVNVYITLTSRFLNPDIWIISRANRHNNAMKLYQAGANHVIEPFEILGLVATEYVGQPVAFEAILGILRGEKHILIKTIAVQKDSFLDNRFIGDIDFRQRKITLFGVISDNPVHVKRKHQYKVQNKHFYFNPGKNFILTKGDILVVFGHELSIDFFRDQIEKNRLSKGI